MRWLSALVLGLTVWAGLSDEAAWGHGWRTTAVGKTVSGQVVSVPDGASVWVYLDEFHASYHFLLTGVDAPAVEQPDGKQAREALAKMLQGATVRVVVERLSNEGPNPAVVYLDGRSVNYQMICLLSGEAGQTAVARSDAPPRRPVLSFLCSMLRWMAP